MARNKYPEETVKLIVDESYKLFIEKGYDNTSIQDIINHLGGLSKGAIYHHFKSKEDIFEAVCDKIGRDNHIYYSRIRDCGGKNGLEKLKMMIQMACTNPANDAMAAMMSKFLSDPRFLTNRIFEIYELVVPRYIQPVIEEGVADGSIDTEYPKELSEVLTTLLNIWLNPVIAKTTGEEMHSKLTFLSILLKGIGLDLLDHETIKRYVELCERFNR